MRLPVQLDDDVLAQLDQTLHSRSVREIEREPLRRFVPLRANAQHRPVALEVVQPPVLVDEPEAAVPTGAATHKIDAFRMNEPERLHRRDRDPRNATLHVPTVVGHRSSGSDDRVAAVTWRASQTPREAPRATRSRDGHRCRAAVATPKALF